MFILFHELSAYEMGSKIEKKVYLNLMVIAIGALYFSGERRNVSTFQIIKEKENEKWFFRWSCDHRQKVLIGHA